MKRITRDRPLTVKEAAKYNEIRRNVYEEFPNPWRDKLPIPPVDFDPGEPEQVEEFLKTYNVKISRDDEPPVTGWGVSYAGGGGIMCPFLKGDTDGTRARAVIALSVYLHIKGVNVALCDKIAYWYIQGPNNS